VARAPRIAALEPPGERADVRRFLAVIPSWRSPELTAIGRLPMHGVPHPDRHVLDGRWRFQLLPAPDAEPDEDGWREIDVPGMWTMQGTGDLPHYTNVQMPWPHQPPDVPEANPTGLYTRGFEIPAGWAGRRVVLHVGAAESVLIVTVNGRDVGMSKDAHLAAEFDVTGLLVPGENEITLRVVKWSDATFVEDQDQWWHGGISRSVFLYATGPVYVADIAAIGGLADDLTTGTLDLTVDLGFAGVLPSAGWTIEAAIPGLLEPVRATNQLPPAAPWPFPTVIRRHIVGGDAAVAEERAAWEREYRVQVPPLAGRVHWDLSIPGVPRWTAETPALHDLHVTVRSPDGELVEEHTLRIGFRRVEIRGVDLLVNGARVFIRGINRHDFDQHTGRVVSRESMREDLLVMKRFGFNAVRTSHYPNDPAFLELTDELGLYVIDEADIESHAFQSTLCDDPRYLAQWVTRVSRMVLRDRSHPSIIAWSLGNESGHGTNHEAAVAWVRAADPSRPLHYEGAIRMDWTSDQASSDLTCPMYPHLADIVEHARSGRQRHPLIMCEYSHAMGNSNGTLADYWDAIESTPGLQGGFIWEFWDHGLVQPLPDGRIRWAYGGDFGEEPHDGNFVLDGMVWPDRRPKPAMWEHRVLAAPVAIALADAGLRLTNRWHFRDLGWLRCDWELAVDGDVLTAGSFDAPAIAPGASEVVSLASLPAADALPGREAWLTTTWSTAAAMPWAPAGTEVCVLQVAVGDGAQWSVPAAAESAAGSAPVDDGGEIVHPLLAAEPALALWRAPTDNDRIGGMAARWAARGLSRLERRVVAVERDGARATVVADVVTGDGTVVRHERVVAAVSDGGVHVEETVHVPDGLDDLPRVGTVLELVPGLERLEWYGTGPHETYPDRRRSGLVGRWATTVTDAATPYVRPQETGGRADVRWLTLTDERGAGARLEFDIPLQASATHFRATDLAAATHDVDLVARPETIVHLDVAHRGLGTASCGPDTLPAYLVGPGTYRWSWRLTPVEAPA
jgi:beta-galactosidase